MNVLVAAPHVPSLRAMSLYLTVWGMHVEQVTTAGQITQTVGWQNPDVIILDERLPGVGGRQQALRRVRCGSSIPRIILTRRRPPRPDANACTGVVYLTAPINMEDLVVACGRAIRGQFRSPAPTIAVGSASRPCPLATVS